MKIRKYHILLIANTLLILLFIVTSVVYAWFYIILYQSSIKLTGSTVVKYFESGNGTESYPFVISEKRHLYNMAWLQNLGKFQGSNHHFI